MFNAVITYVKSPNLGFDVFSSFLHECSRLIRIHNFDQTILLVITGNGLDLCASQGG